MMERWQMLLVLGLGTVVGLALTVLIAVWALQPA